MRFTGQVNQPEAVMSAVTTSVLRSTPACEGRNGMSISLPMIDIASR
ncbi:MAG: hypothetical protein ACKOFP_10615 [Actinomycetota bacterium]